jgi:predicted nuclease of predicted toxin-antitoxin system
MKFIVDVQLPKALTQWLRDRGYDAVHVLDRGQGQAVAEGRIMVSKDEDFFLLASRPDDPLALLWLRLGNCRTQQLLSALNRAWPDIESAFQSGQRIVELR